MRHQITDKIFHWLNAIVVIVLMVTGFLPKLGLSFNWPNFHWLAGILLLLLTLFHMYRAIFRLESKAMNIGMSDLKYDSSRKYNFTQKGIHLIFSALILLIIMTGFLMALKADVVGITRNAYIFEEHTWGWIYALHGLVSLMLLSFVMIHTYFNLRKENRVYLLSMLFYKSK